MSAFTVRFQPEPSDAEIRAAEAAAHDLGARVTWQHATACKRMYGLVEGASPACISTLREATVATVYDRPVIALAVFPSVAEALPQLLRALGGPGRPDGVHACDRCEGGMIVEWDLDATPLDVIMNLIDIEIDRFHARRVNVLLNPLPLAWWTTIAASGLRAPEITPERVLEEQLEVQHVVG
ncbi:MAG TPA: hypothetical protein VMB20_07190 [Candidatus Acidoferrum sp.]|nr:hypothetical protein [Candidatus Acidoferrum sp.]